MSNIIRANSYNILGLDITAGQREVLKRSKDMIGLLKIESIPDYDSQLNVFDNMISEDAIREAAQRLSNPRKKIKDYFFWFQIQDSEDGSAFSLVKQGDYRAAVDAWREASDKNQSRSLFYKKNLAILYLLLLSLKSNKAYLKNSLKIWGELIGSELFWSNFKKIYKLHDEGITSQDVITDFCENVKEDLSDIYADLGRQYGDSNYIKELSEIFSVRGKKIEEEFLTPVYKEIDKAVKEMEAMNISEDGVFDDQEAEKVKDIIGRFQEESNRLIDLGLYDDSRSMAMRDRMGKAIRSIVLDLHNNLGETSKSLALMEVADQISGTDSFKSKIKEDINILEGVKKQEGLIKPIIDLMAQEKYEEAWNLILDGRQKYAQDKELQKLYDSHAKACVAFLAMGKYKQARYYFDSKQEDLAKPLFAASKKLIYDNIDLFNLNKTVVDEIISDIRKRLAGINIKNIGQIDDFRNSLVKLAQEKLGGQFEETVFIVLIDSYLFGGLADFTKDFRHKTSVANTLYTIGWLTIWIYGIGIIFFIIGWFYKNQE